jgi:hypothetical protein
MKKSRRDFLRLAGCAIVGAPAAAKALAEGPPATFDAERTYGLVRAKDSPWFKAFLNGEDVSSQCTEADDREGWVCIIDADKDGRFTWPITSRRVYGKVRITPWE